MGGDQWDDSVKILKCK